MVGNIRLLAPVVSGLGVSLALTNQLISADTANLILLIVCITMFKTKAAGYAAFRFFIYFVITSILLNGSSIEYDRGAFLVAALVTVIIELGFTIQASKIQSPTKYLYLINALTACLCALSVIAIDVFPENLYNIVNAGIPVMIMGALTYEGFTRIN